MSACNKGTCVGEEELNHSLERLGQLIKDTAWATHALSCGVPDRESSEVRFLQEALDLIEECQRRGPVGERLRSPWWNGKCDQCWHEK